MVRILYESQEPLDRLRKFIHSIIISKIFNLVSILTLILVIPLTIFLAQQQQDLRQRAQTLPITPPSPSISQSKTAKIELFPVMKDLSVGQEHTFLINLDPGFHKISFVQLKIDFDPYDIATSGAGLVINEAAFPVTLNKSYGRGTVTTHLGIGQDPRNVFRGGTFATLTVKAIGEHGPKVSQVKFDTYNNNTQALSLSSNDPPSLNVLGAFTNATINIVASLSKAPDFTCTPCSADVTGNGKVSKSDFNRVFKKCFNKSPSTKQCSTSDIDKNGAIDLYDINCVTQQMNLKCNKRTQKAEPTEELP